jgi:hypothetical protein
MSKVIYIKWCTKLDSLENDPSKHIKKIYLTREEAELDKESEYIDEFNKRFWVVGTYDDCIDKCYISAVKIDADEPILYFVKYDWYKSWASCGIYVFMCDKDRLDFISNDLIGSNKNITFVTDDKKRTKDDLINELIETNSCQYETLIKKKYDTQILIRTFEININDIL